MRYVIPIACAVLLTAAASPSFARNDGTKAAPPRGSAGKFEAPHETAKAPSVTFSSADSTLVRVYFAQNQVAWTGLPPGLAKNFARGKPLPPGIARKVLPADLQARLPVRRGFEYARVGQDVILIETATRIVADVIEHVFG